MFFKGNGPKSHTRKTYDSINHLKVPIIIYTYLHSNGKQTIDMKTWLFTWNPKRWRWDDKYHGYLEMKHQISQVGRSFATWSSSSNKSIKAGDRIFLIRLGVEPRGIIASGYAATGVFEGPHWDRERAARGDSCRRIFIEFDRILDAENEAIVPIDLLKTKFPSVCWSSQCSGIEIPLEVAMELENSW